VRWFMGQIMRCPLVGIPCTKPITIEEKTFFLAEAEEPDYDKKHRDKAISEAIADGYKIRSALEEKGINAFTCKICEMIQTCAYGMADISQNNANVFMELGMMLALGKPTIILAKKGQEEKLKLPSDVTAIEIIPFDEYLDIIDQLREVVQKLPTVVSPPSPIEDLEKIQPQFAQELKKMEQHLVQEFKNSVREAKIDILSFDEERKDISPELNEKLRMLEGQMENMSRLGISMDAEAAALKGNYLHYLVSFNLSLELRPDHPDTLTNRAEIKMHLGKFEEALLDCNRSLELKPNNEEALDVRGSAFALLGKHKKALADYNRSLEVKPDDPCTLSNRGGTYHELKRYNKALADYNRSLELRPDAPGTLSNRGDTYHELKKYNEAITDYSRSLELRPDDPDTLSNRGGTYHELKRYNKALADYNRSLELSPEHAETLYNLACLYSLKGNADDALTSLEKAIGKDKKYQEMAETDKDFDNIREDPRFKKLIGED